MALPLQQQNSQLNNPLTGCIIAAGIFTFRKFYCYIIFILSTKYDNLYKSYNNTLNAFLKGVLLYDPRLFYHTV